MLATLHGTENGVQRDENFHSNLFACYVIYGTSKQVRGLYYL